MNWTDFYDRFYDWADSTKIKQMSSLSEFGDEDEVYDIAIEYSCISNEQCTRFLKKAIANGVHFTSAHIVELVCNVNESFIPTLVKHNSTPYTTDELLEVECYLDDEDFLQLEKSSNAKYSTWELYYERHFDWSDADKVNRAKELESFGEQEEVYEVATSFMDSKLCTQFLMQAVEKGVRFSPENILLLVYDIEEIFIWQFVNYNNAPYTNEQLEELSSFLDEAKMKKLAKRSGVKYMIEEPVQSSKGLGFWGFLGALGAIADASNKGEKKDTGRCDGDCANCPPHYGYRYGRWYYGHDHTEGCTRGGNRGGGGII